MRSPAAAQARTCHSPKPVFGPNCPLGKMDYTTMKVNMSLLGTLVLTAVAAFIPAGVASSGSPIAPTSSVRDGGWGEYHVNGPATCNCNEVAEEHEVCISSTVEVSVGSSVVTVKTGVSEGTCAKKTLAPGECLYYIYNFKCKNGFWGYTCKYQSAGTHTRKATSIDCPTPSL